MLDPNGIRPPFVLLLALALHVAACHREASVEPPPVIELPTKPGEPVEPPMAVFSEVGQRKRLPNATCVAPPRPRPPASVEVALEPAFGDERFAEAVWMVQAPGADDWYVLERAGRVVRIDAASGERSVFAEVTDAVNSDPYHGGFLGVAFHPRYPDDPRVFLSYTTGPWARLQSHVAAYRLGEDGRLDPESARVIISLDQPSSPHNGGHIEFGRDGYLYIAFGDGQLGGDPPNNALNPETFLGKLLRIDVDVPDSAEPPYVVPPDNPFVDGPGLPEIYALGFRNPWRFSFDRATGEMWLGDVGDADWEEINRVEAGGNYGWPGRQGAHCFRRRLGCEQPEWIDPVIEYSHDEGISVTGGYVYRGTAIPALQGAYLFSDYGSGVLWSLTFDEAGQPQRETLLRTGHNVASFAQGHDGELYLLHYHGSRGRVFRLVAAEGADEAPESYPARLSETGCVDPDDPTRMAPGVLPYVMNAPFWSDGATKQRWLALPDGETASVGDDGDIELPVGSVVIKEFMLGDRRVETRLLVRHDDGAWAGFTYAWREDGSDADLVQGGRRVDIDGQSWLYPSSAQCLECHTEAAGRTLGLELAQLDRWSTWGENSAGSVRVARQVETLQAIGVLPATLPDGWDTLPGPLSFHGLPGQGAGTGERARAWLHTNCSFCHRPGSVGMGDLDLRYGTAVVDTGLCAAEGAELPGTEATALFVEGAPEQSTLWHRVQRRDAYGMPPLASDLVDHDGVALLAAWIRESQACGVDP